LCPLCANITHRRTKESKSLQIPSLCPPPTHTHTHTHRQTQTDTDTHTHHTHREKHPSHASNNRCVYSCVYMGLCLFVTGGVCTVYMCVCVCVCYIFMFIYWSVYIRDRRCMYCMRVCVCVCVCVCCVSSPLCVPGSVTE